MSRNAETNAGGDPEATLALQAKAPSSKVQRIPALDFTKGALVLIMVLYHWVNYFIGPQWPYYRYLRFLTPSFIFITGFMISHIYLSKYDAADPRLAKRLLVRGLKLLAIFIVLNVARMLATPILSTGGVVGNPLDPRSIFAVFVSGDVSVGGGKIAAFYILVPISYILILSAALLRPYRAFRYTFHLMCVVLLASILALDLIGTQSQGLELVTIGLLGVLTGFAPIAKINKFVRHPYLLAFTYLCYVFAITIWNVPFPLQIVGVSLNVIAIYAVGSSAGEPSRMKRHVILLGKYSLFGYVGQIAVLQILSAGFRHVHPGLYVLVITFVAAFVLTMLSVELLDRARSRAARMDRLYKAVFA